MKGEKKIMPIEELARVLEKRRPKKKIVLCHGPFDLLHIGHIRHLEQAKNLGDILIVTVTPDNYMKKRLYNPVFVENLRAGTIAALNCVDYVAINKGPSAVEAVELLKPNIYVKADEYTDHLSDPDDRISEENAVVESYGGEVATIKDSVLNSSNLINNYLPILPGETQSFLSGFSERYSVNQVLHYLEKAQSLKVLVVGETIIDEYLYCESIGKSAKEPIIAVKHISDERYAGGVIAVANHLANFCDVVGVVSYLGTRGSQEKFIKQNSRSNIDSTFLYKSNSPTIVKRRYLESYLQQKLFEVYEINDEDLNKEQNEELCGIIEKALPKYDVVIVADYGHGMLTREAIEILCSKSKFLAVNTQANAGNRGLNTISKYPRADYISLAHHEIILEERNQPRKIKDMILNVSNKLGCGKILITLGKDGSMGYTDSEGFFEVPAFAPYVVDRVGAGDAVLSLTAVCLALQAPMEIVGFIGNVVGAQAVLTLGNRKSIERTPLFEHIKTLMR